MSIEKKDSELIPKFIIHAFEKELADFAQKRTQELHKQLEDEMKKQAEFIVTGIALTLSKRLKVDSFGEILTIDLKSHL